MAKQFGALRQFQFTWFHNLLVRPVLVVLRFLLVNAVLVGSWSGLEFLFSSTRLERYIVLEWMEKSFCLLPVLSFAGLFPGGIDIDLSVFIQSFIHSVIQYLGDASVVYPWVMALMDDVSTVFLFFHSLMRCSTLRMTDICLVCRPMFRIGRSRTWIEFVVYAVMVYALSWENQKKKEIIHAKRNN